LALLGVELGEVGLLVALTTINWAGVLAVDWLLVGP